MKNIIVGLVVAIAAGIIVLAVEYNYFNPKTVTQRSADVSKPTAPSGDSTDQRLSGNAPLTSKPPSNPQTTTTQEKLRKMHIAAKEISYDTSARNKALRDVINEAIRFKDYNFAITVAQDIGYDTTARNNALEEIINNACSGLGGQVLFLAYLFPCAITLFLKLHY